MPLVTTALVVVVAPVVADRLFFLNFLPNTKNKMAAIMPIRHSAIKRAMMIFRVDQPEMIERNS